MTGEWAGQDIFTGISDEVIISVLSKDHPHIQAALCTTVKLNLEWRFHFPSSWPHPLFSFSPATAESVPSKSKFGLTIGLTSLNASVMFLQCDAVSKSASNQGPQDHLGPSGDRGEDPFLEDSSAPLRTSEGTSGTTKRTVSFTIQAFHVRAQCSITNFHPVSCSFRLFFWQSLIFYLCIVGNRLRQIGRSVCSYSCYWNLFSGTFDSDSVICQHLCLHQPCRDLHSISLTCQLPHL